MLTSLKTKRKWAASLRANQTTSEPPRKSKTARNLFLMTLVASLAGGGSYWYYLTQQEEQQQREETLVKMIKERLRNLRQQLPKNNTNSNNASTPNTNSPALAPCLMPDNVSSDDEATAASAEEGATSVAVDAIPSVVATISEAGAATASNNSNDSIVDSNDSIVDSNDSNVSSNDAAPPQADRAVSALEDAGAVPEAPIEEVVEGLAVPIAESALDPAEKEEIEREIGRVVDSLARLTVEPAPSFLESEQLAIEEAKKRVELLLTVLDDIAKESEEAVVDTVERIDQDGTIDVVLEEVDRRLRETSARAEFEAGEAERQATLEAEAAREREEAEARERAEREASEERERLARAAQEAAEQAAREEEARQKREAEARALAELQRAEELAEQQAAAEQAAKEERLRQETKDSLVAEIHDALQARAPHQADSQYSAVIANDVVQALLDKILAEKMDHLATEQELADVYNAHLRSQSLACEAALEKEVTQYNAHLEALHAAYEREINNFIRQAKSRYDEDLKRDFNALVAESEVVHQDVLQHHLDALHDYSALLQLYAKQDEIVYETEGMLRNVQAYLALESINDNAGYPFARQLSDVAKLVQNDDFMTRALARITPTAANSGIRTLHQLQEDFNTVDQQTRLRAQNESQESGGFFSSLFAPSPKQYPAGLVPGDDYNAILARAKYYLQSKGNLDKAISELDQLPPVLKEQCESWIERANDRRNLDDVTRTFRARVLMQTTNARDTWSSVMPVNIQKQFEERQ